MAKGIGLFFFISLASCASARPAEMQSEPALACRYGFVLRVEDEAACLAGIRQEECRFAYAFMEEMCKRDDIPVDAIGLGFLPVEMRSIFNKEGLVVVAVQQGVKLGDWTVSWPAGGSVDVERNVQLLLEDISSLARLKARLECGPPI